MASGLCSSPFLFQAAEQVLKGALLDLVLGPPRPPLFVYLLQRLQAAVIEAAALHTLPLNTLSRMGITSRYPDSLQDGAPTDHFGRLHSFH